MVWRRKQNKYTISFLDFYVFFYHIMKYITGHSYFHMLPDSNRVQCTPTGHSCIYSDICRRPYNHNVPVQSKILLLPKCWSNTVAKLNWWIPIPIPMGLEGLDWQWDFGPIHTLPGTLHVWYVVKVLLVLVEHAQYHEIHDQIVFLPKPLYPKSISYCKW